MNFGIIIFPGSNCDLDCFHVIKNVFKKDVSYIWHEDNNLSRFDCIILPGGFSYGDYLRAGAIARFSKVMNSLKKYAQKGRGLVIGICNGFQILTEAGLLPGALTRNKNLKFICKFVKIKVKNTKTPFTNLCKKDQILNIPIAHAEGNYTCSEEILKKLKKKNQIVFQYSGENPNGSLLNIAGICNEKGNVLGMMPHPERASEEILGSTDGKFIFESIIKHLEKKAYK